ncbi:MAG: leucine-rich repeat domain-containing protein, partial [Prevotellaceae bacterium]|nr:leucine-rich repeat domain-containing protein [Prevotellaceae bacterium]
AFSGCTSLTAVTIPNSVTSLEYSTFQECSSLTQVTIGNSVTSIGYRAFYGCCSLIEIYSANPTPPSVNSSYTFSGVDNEACTLYVPEGCVDAYSWATYWSDFNIHEYDVTSVQGVRGTGETQIISINSLDGKQVSALQRGINIIRYSDGTVKKELVK